MGIGTFGRRVPDQIIVGSIRDQEGGSAGPGRVVLSHPPLTPTFTSPRLAPIPPKPSSIRSFNSFASSIFRKQQQPRASSLRSTTSEDTLPSHPFSAMHLAPSPSYPTMIPMTRRTAQSASSRSASASDYPEKSLISYQSVAMLFTRYLVSSCQQNFLITAPRLALLLYTAHHPARRAQQYRESQIWASAVFAGGQ